jgi:peptidoglycan hydrolase CwlO-like protein
MIKIGEFIGKYTWQLGALSLFIVMMWLNTMYVTLATHEKHEEKVSQYGIRLQKLEHDITQLEVDLLTAERRLQNYISRYGDLKEEVDNNENDIIKLFERVKK